MKNEGEIRWLQLSDLHIFDSTTFRRQKEKLFARFRDTIDFVVITGDLHEYESDYAPTLRFLEELTEKMEISREDIIIVPGNHDVSDSARRKKNLEFIENNISSDADAYYSVLDELHSDFAQYKKFLLAFYGSDTDFHFLNNYIYIWKNKIALLCLNTALASDENHDKKQIVDIRGLNELENDHYPCIAIMHHNYYAITNSQRMFVRTVFNALGVSAVLSGHEHKSSKDTIELEDGVVIPNYCCGKSFSEPKDLWSDIEIIEYRWKATEKKTMIITYEWNSFRLRFTPSTKLEKHAHIIDGKIKLEQAFTWRKFFPEIPRKTEPQTSPAVLPPGKNPALPAKPESTFQKFKEELRILVASAAVSLVLAVIVWNNYYSADSSQQFQLCYTETLNDTLIVLENRNVMREALLQTTGQVIVTINGKTVETFIIDGMYQQTAVAHNNKKILLEAYECPLADSCVKKLQEELESLSALYGFAEEDISVRKIAFMYVSASMGNSGEWISRYCIFDNGSLIYLDNDAAEAKMYGVALTEQNWNNPDEQEKILADMKTHVHAELGKTPSDY